MRGKEQFYHAIKEEVARIDALGVTKRKENIIEGFKREDDRAPQALIKGKPYMIFNSNDYLGLRHHPKVLVGEEDAAKQFGSGPGAVRFISGTLLIHKRLEEALAKFHQREDAMIFSSTFALSVGVLYALIKGQSRQSLLTKDVLVLSDQANHRSIIDGIRVANLPKEQRVVFKHIDMEHLKEVLEENKGKYSRVVIVSDGVFSMLGTYQDLKQLTQLAKEYDTEFEQGILTVIDDAHGVAAFGATGRGTEEVCSAQADLLISTLGKGLGVDGGYITGKKVVIDLLRESVATYIYSNPISPGTAGAALAALQVIDSPEGKILLERLQENTNYLKEELTKKGFSFCADSVHPIQPLHVGDSLKTKKIVDLLLAQGVIVTNISYPVVPEGQDEIRIQLSASHTKKDLDEFVKKITMVAKEVQLIN